MVSRGLNDVSNDYSDKTPKDEAIPVFSQRVNRVLDFNSFDESSCLPSETRPKKPINNLTIASLLGEAANTCTIKPEDEEFDVDKRNKKAAGLTS